MRPRVSLCLIAKNEEGNLSTCLGSVADLVDEMIVVDTGSTDRTREEAARLGARVLDFTWVDDFAAARNESLCHAAGAWIFWLDGDESLDAENRERLRSLFAGLKEENAAYVMQQRSVSNRDPGEASIFAQVRLFRNLPHIRWQYRIHEQILPALERANTIIRWADVFIEHAGYQDPAVYQHKQQRNLQLLLRQDAERPEDPLTLFNLGLTHLALGRVADAMPYLQRSLKLSSPTLSLVRKLYALLAKGHLQLGKREAALAMCRTGLARYPEDVELLSLEAGILSERGDLAGTEGCLLRILQTPPQQYFAASLDVGLRGYKSRHNLALIYRAQKREADAENQWRAALAERPDYAPALLELGNLYLAQGRREDLEAVVGQLAASPQGQAGAAQLRALAYLATQDLGAARRALEDAVARWPHELQLNVLLSRVLLRESRDGAAIERALRGILALDPYHLEARNNLTVFLRQHGREADSIPAAIANELFQRAEKAFRTANYADAAALYRCLLHARFQPGVMHYRLAMVANVQGDFAGAWELHLQAIAIDPALSSQITPPESPHHHIVCRPTYDIEEVAACPVCGGTSQAAMMVVNCLSFNHYHPSLHPVRRWVRCVTCGHGFANPRPGPAALRQAYEDPPPAHLLSWTYDRLTLFSDIVHDLWQRLPGGSLLDVGAGNGALAGVAVDYGYRVCALDVHPAYADHVRRLGVEFLLGDVSSYDFGSRRLDVITLGDVIEHLAEPSQLMKKLASVLKPDGLIWLSTPNYEGVWTRSMREQDAMWMEGEHLQLFCLASLRRLLADHGLAIVDYRLSKRFVGCAEVVIQRAVKAAGESPAVPRIP
jgi:tetratricopeptide (TPR) repeat protein/SAM-dependent methyltransferase